MYFGFSGSTASSRRCSIKIKLTLVPFDRLTPAFYALKVRASVMSVFTIPLSPSALTLDSTLPVASCRSNRGGATRGICQAV